MTTDATSTSTQAPVRIASGPFSIGNVSQREKKLKMLIYGKAGTGKTTFAASAVDVPQMGHILMINAEGGELVFHDNIRIKNPTGIDIATVDQFNDVPKMCDFLIKHVKYRNMNNDAGDDLLRKQESQFSGVPWQEIKTPKKYNTIIVDSLSEINAYCMNTLLAVSGKFKLEDITSEMKAPEFVEYNKNNYMINTLVRAFRDLDINSVIICGRNFEQDEMKRYHYTPALTGKLSTQVQGYMDIVAYLASSDKPDDKGVVNRRLMLQPTSKWDAKCRISSFKDPHLENPTMSSLMKAMGLLKE